MIKYKEGPTIFYQRSGILSTETKVDSAKAKLFMQLSDLRRDIILTDSGKEPEPSSTQIGQDVLAWKMIDQRFPDLKKVLGGNKYRQVIKNPTSYEIQINDEEISQKIRSKTYKDLADYQQKFLGLLNKTIRGGILNCLTSEKLGSNYLLGYGLYGGYFQQRALEGNLSLEQHDLIALPILNIFGNLIYSIFGNPLSPSHRDWKESILPPVPIDRWVLGAGYLYTKGSNLIIPKDSIKSYLLGGIP